MHKIGRIRSKIERERDYSSSYSIVECQGYRKKTIVRPMVIFTQVKQPTSRSSEKGKKLQLSLPSDTPSQSQDVTHSGEEDDELVHLDKVITLPMYDLNNLTLEKM